MVNVLLAHFDIHLSMTSQVSAVCRKCYFHLRRIASIRNYISKSVCHRLVIALVVSNLDYCNALLLDIPGYLLRRLQVVHHRAARLVTLTSPRGHITPVMEALHWLPVSHRIIFKTPLLVYKALNGLAPGYLSDLLNLKNRNSKLRQLHDHLTLSVPQATLTIAKRAFGVTAPVYWNLLPLSLRQASSLRAFKSGLKTHFFRSLYDNECQF